MPQMFPEQLFVVSTKAARLTMINSRLTEVQKDNVVKAGAKMDRIFMLFTYSLSIRVCLLRRYTNANFARSSRITSF